MKIIPIRLEPNADLRDSLKSYSVKHNIQAGFILTGIGSLKKATIRLANEEYSTVLNEKFEILSLNGTLATTGVHLHIAYAKRMPKAYR